MRRSRGRRQRAAEHDELAPVGVGSQHEHAVEGSRIRDEVASSIQCVVEVVQRNIRNEGCGQTTITSRTCGHPPWELAATSSGNARRKPYTRNTPSLVCDSPQSFQSTSIRMRGCVPFGIQGTERSEKVFPGSSVTHAGTSPPSQRKVGDSFAHAKADPLSRKSHACVAADARNAEPVFTRLRLRGPKDPGLDRASLASNVFVASVTE
jgi:hypothetical protein